MVLKFKAQKLSDIVNVREGGFVDQVVKITLINGQAIFVQPGDSRSGQSPEQWPLHGEFIPNSVQNLLNARPEGTCAFVADAEVGKQLVIYTERGLSRHQAVVTPSNVLSLEICPYRDAYHDDLTLL